MADFYKLAVEPINKGFVKGGYVELKKRFPDRLKQINSTLESNFNARGMIQYRDSIVAGLKKINYWKE